MRDRPINQMVSKCPSRKLPYDDGSLHVVFYGRGSRFWGQSEECRDVQFCTDLSDSMPKFFGFACSAAWAGPRTGGLRGWERCFPIFQTNPSASSRAMRSADRCRPFSRRADRQPTWLAAGSLCTFSGHHSRLFLLVGDERRKHTLPGKVSWLSLEPKRVEPRDTVAGSLPRFFALRWFLAQFPNRSFSA